MRKVVCIYLLLALLTSASSANDTTTIRCVFRTPHLPAGDELILIPRISAWSDDFSHHLFIPDSLQKFRNTGIIRQQVNDSTWNIKFVIPDDRYYQVYSLAMLGSSITVFLDKETRNQKIYIDTTSSDIFPYKATCASESKFAFGIELYNSCNLGRAKDSVGIAENLAKINKVFYDLRKRYEKERASDEAFKKFTEFEFMWKASMMNYYSSTLAGKKHNDSLKRSFLTLIKDSPVVYSRASTYFGTMWLTQEIKVDADSLKSAINDIGKRIASGRYHDFLLESYYISITRHPGITKEILDTLYEYTNPRVKTSYLNWALSTAHRQYINEHQQLSQELLNTTQLITETNGTLTLAQLIDKLKSSGKKRIIMDFWASWCGPCKQEIMESGAFLDSIKQQNPDLAYIYFNIDVPKKYEAAKQFSAQERFSDNNYLLQGANESTLFKYYTIPAIPYHVYLDLSTLKFNANMRGPWDRDVFKKLLKQYSTSKTDITY